jgi:hypothetical protein
MPPYPEEQRWNSQPRANYPNGDSYGRSPQPQVGYQGQAPASPYPGSQGTYPQQLDFGGNNLYTGNNSFASSNPYAVPPAAPTMYQPPAAPYAPPPVPGVYAPPYMSPYGMVDPNQGKATAGLVLGIITAILSVTWWIASIFGLIAFIVCGILGIIFSALGRRSLTKKTSATVGLVLSIIGLVLGILIFILFLMIGLAALNSQTP